MCIYKCNILTLGHAVAQTDDLKSLGVLKRSAFRNANFKIEIWLGPRKQGKITHTASLYILVTMAVKKCQIFPCFCNLQIAILKIAFLNAGLFLKFVVPIPDERNLGAYNMPIKGDIRNPGCFSVSR